MERQQRVLLYGNTLVLAGLRASLEANPAFEVVTLDASQVAEQELFALNPDIVIFDTGSVRPQFHDELLHQRAELLLVGIDPATNQVLLWSGQSMRELTVQDLVAVILQQQSRSGLPKKDKT